MNIDYLIKQKELLQKFMALVCNHADWLDQQIRDTDVAINKIRMQEIKKTTEL